MAAVAPLEGRHFDVDPEDQAPLLTPSAAEEERSMQRRLRMAVASAGVAVFLVLVALAGASSFLAIHGTAVTHTVADFYDVASLAETPGNASGNATNESENETHLEEIYLSNVSYALVLRDVAAKGDGKLSAKEGDLVIAGHGGKDGWTFGYKDQLSGYVPTDALNLNMTRAVGNYTLPEKNSEGQLEVSVGEKVWLTAKSEWGRNWTSIDKVARNGTVLHGWVPQWAVRAHGGNCSNKTAKVGGTDKADKKSVKQLGASKEASKEAGKEASKEAKKEKTDEKADR